MGILPDGVTDWVEYKKQFEVTATINDWDEKDMARYLVGNLTGAARSVLYDLTREQMDSWDEVVGRIEAMYDYVGR